MTHVEMMDVQNFLNKFVANAASRKQTLKHFGAFVKSRDIFVQW